MRNGFFDLPTSERMEGYLLKQGKGESTFGRKSWKKRWVLVEGGVLKYFENKHVMENRFAPFGVIRVTRGDTVEMVTFDDDSHHEWSFRLVTEKRTLYLCASSEEERQEWIDFLRLHIRKST